MVMQMLSERELQILQLQLYGELKRKEKRMPEEPDYRPHAPSEPIWRPNDEKK